MKVNSSTRRLIFFWVVVMMFLSSANGGPLAACAAYGICQTGCNGVAVACYTAAGMTFGTITGGAGVPAVILGCNAALGKCMGTCAVVTAFGSFLPTW